VLLMFPRKMLFVSLVSALLTLVLTNSALAWVYTVSTSCNTGFGANGTTVLCEPKPLMFPSDCYFVEFPYYPYNNYVAHLNQRGNFSGTCWGDTQYISHYFPDTSGAVTVAHSCSQTPFTDDWDITPDSVLSAYGSCLPSVSISCQLNNLMTLGCWRNSTDISINGGFETIYTTTLATGANWLQIAGNKTYIPNWNLPNNIWYFYGQPQTAFITNISAVEWWGKVGNQFLNVSNFAGVPIIPYVSQSIQLPPFSDLGNLWNISYNLETNVSSVGSPHVPYFTSYIVFNDLTTFVIQNPTTGEPSNAYYNGTFSQSVNFGNKTGDAILYFVISSNYGGGDYGVGYFYLDDVRITSLCAGVDCINASIYMPPNVTVTTTTISPISPIAETYHDFLYSSMSFLGGILGTTADMALFMSWTIISLIGSGYIVYKTKSGQFGAISMFALMVVGMGIGWIPALFGILIIVFVLALLAYMFRDIVFGKSGG